MGEINALFRFYCLPVILWPFVIWTLVLLLPVIVIVYILRSTENLIYCTLYGAERFPCNDIVWTMGKPENQLSINCCLIVDGVLPISSFWKLIDECLIKSEDDEGNLLYWKATKRIHPGYINYYWVDDEMFDIKDHVYDLLDDVVSSEEELKEVISAHQSSEFSFNNGGSPWEFVLIPYEENSRRKTVIFCRLSHAIADGSALAYFLINRLGEYQYPCKDQMILKYSQGRHGISKIDKLLLNLKGIWTIPVVLCDFLFSRKDKNTLHVDHATGNKTISWSKPINLDMVKAIKNMLHTTVNDVLLGCLAKSLNDFFRERCEEPKREVTVVFPFDVRLSPDEARDFKNHLAVMMIRLPTISTDVVSSIKEAKRRIDLIKKCGEPIGSFISWKFLSFLLPGFIAKFFVYNTIAKTTGSFSNLLGPQETITIGGHPLDLLAFWAPQTNNHSFGAAFCSYNGHIRMCVECDDSAWSDPQRIISIFEDNINKLNCLP